METSGTFCTTVARVRFPVSIAEVNKDAVLYRGKLGTTWFSSICPYVCMLPLRFCVYSQWVLWHIHECFIIMWTLWQGHIRIFNCCSYVPFQHTGNIYLVFSVGASVAKQPLTWYATSYTVYTAYLSCWLYHYYIIFWDQSTYGVSWLSERFSCKTISLITLLRVECWTIGLLVAVPRCLPGQDIWNFFLFKSMPVHHQHTLGMEAWSAPWV